MLKNRKHRLFLLYTTATFFASALIFSLVAKQNQATRNLLDEWGILSIFCIFLVVTIFFFLMIPSWNYFRAYRTAKKICKLNHGLILTAEDILLLERIFTLKKILELSIDDPEFILKMLSRSICLSQIIKK